MLLPGLTLDEILLAMLSLVAGIIGIDHHAQLVF
jgi:hypothetical protein